MAPLCGIFLLATPDMVFSLCDGVVVGCERMHDERLRESALIIEPQQREGLACQAKATRMITSIAESVRR